MTLLNPQNQKVPGKKVKNRDSLFTFIAKYSVISTIVTLIAAQIYNKHTDRFVNYIISPFFAIDIDMNGEPNLSRLQRYQFTLFNSTFKVPVGMILFNFMEMIIKIIILLVLIKLILKYVVIYL